MIKRYVYDAHGNITKEMDAEGYACADNDEDRIGILYRYNAIGWLTEKREPVKREEGRVLYRLTGYRYAYDPQGRIRGITGPDGNVIQKNTYDRAGRLLRQTDGTDAGIEFTYNLAGDRVYFRTMGGATQELARDARGNTTVCEETVENRFRFNGQQQDPIIKIDMWMTGSLESVNFDRQIPTRHPLNNDKMPFWILRTFSGRHGITLAGGILCIYFTDTENGTNSCGRMRKYGKNWEGLPLFII